MTDQERKAFYDKLASWNTKPSTQPKKVVKKRKTSYRKMYDEAVRLSDPITMAADSETF